jgi:hypothetical protein
MWTRLWKNRFNILLIVFYWLSIFCGVCRFKFNAKKKRFFRNKVLTTYSICLSFLLIIISVPIFKVFMEYNLQSIEVDDFGFFIASTMWKVAFACLYFHFLVSVYYLWQKNFDILGFLNDGLELLIDIYKKTRICLRLDDKFFCIPVLCLLVDLINFLESSMICLTNYLRDGGLINLFYWDIQLVIMICTLIQYFKCFLFLYASQLFKGLQRRLEKLSINCSKTNSQEMAVILKLYQKIFEFLVELENSLICQTSVGLLTHFIGATQAVK